MKGGPQTLTRAPEPRTGAAALLAAQLPDTDEGRALATWAADVGQALLDVRGLLRSLPKRRG